MLLPIYWLCGWLVLFLSSLYNSTFHSIFKWITGKYFFWFHKVVIFLMQEGFLTWWISFVKNPELLESILKAIACLDVETFPCVFPSCGFKVSCVTLRSLVHCDSFLCVWWETWIWFHSSTDEWSMSLAFRVEDALSFPMDIIPRTICLPRNIWL